MLLFDGPKDVEKMLLIKNNIALEEENHNLKCQIRILQDKVKALDYENKLKMSDIVRYRRLIEHYEDGAPNYVATHG